MADSYVWILFKCGTGNSNSKIYPLFSNAKGTFTNYVYKIWLFLTTYPPAFTFSLV